MQYKYLRIAESLGVPEDAHIEVEGIEDTIFVVFSMLWKGEWEEEEYKGVDFNEQLAEDLLAGKIRYKVVDIVLEELGKSVLNLLKRLGKSEEPDFTCRYIIVDKVKDTGQWEANFFFFIDTLALPTDFWGEYAFTCGYPSLAVIGKYLEMDRYYDLLDESWQEEILAVTDWHYHK